MKVMMIDLNQEMAWVTFFNDGWETQWYPITDVFGNHLPFDDTTMDHCRTQFNNTENWVYFGIAPTSQMLMRNAVRDNL
jgi:hypothetical protein